MNNNTYVSKHVQWINREELVQKVKETVTEIIGGK
jgi:hypothetical protein